MKHCVIPLDLSRSSFAVYESISRSNCLELCDKVQ